jgi:hypothetical protein
MGWTTTYKPKGEGIVEFLAHHCVNCSNEHGSWTLLKGKVIKGVAYMAIRRTLPESTGQEPYVYAGVYKVQMYPKSDYNFGWKDMDESCGPFYYDCPGDILDMLTSTDNENALAWRAECRKRNTASAAVKLTAGVIVMFTEAIRFTDGFSATKFQVDDARRGVVTPMVQSGLFAGSKYKISNLRQRIVEGAAKILGDIDDGTNEAQLSLIGGSCECF